MDDFFATIKQKDQLPVIFTAINHDTVSCQQLLFINHMKDSIAKLEETVSTLQNEVDQQKAIAQAKLDDFFTWKSTKRIYWTAQNILVEHGFWVPGITPSASSKYSLDTMPVLSSSASIYKMADEFLDQNFPTMALGLSGNLIIVSDNEDWFDESRI